MKVIIKTSLGDITVRLYIATTSLSLLAKATMMAHSSIVLSKTS